MIAYRRTTDVNTLIPVADMELRVRTTGHSANNFLGCPDTYLALWRGRAAHVKLLTNGRQITTGTTASEAVRKLSGRRNDAEHIKLYPSQQATGRSRVRMCRIAGTDLSHLLYSSSHARPHLECNRHCLARISGAVHLHEGYAVFASFVCTVSNIIYAVRENV